MSDTVVRDGRVLTIRVASGKANAVDEEAMTEVAAALRGLATVEQAAEQGIGAVQIVHPGGNFCAGGDVRAFAGAPDRGVYVKHIADVFHEFLESYVQCAVPTVIGAQGWSAGAGMSIALATDVLLVGGSSKIRPAYPGIGFSPDGGMSWTLPRIVGLGRARHIIMTDQVLGAEDMLGLGIASVLVDDADLAAEAAATAYKIAQGPTAALGRIKRLLAGTFDHDLRSHLDAEAAAISASAAGPEGGEGLTAFGEKRAPRFQG
ncbi:enoyl-CoA hydratase/isomerase family protein [Pseudonocardia pini]|uniref:enoyl-CoA hydratase/isomerase family protein n=1 Tax=Pseudonocardia pini TaxID=2758030 RepID=UPI0015F0FEB2|nr:enoyl-CoA hydratase-related protein [Pseudonocardia pini]